MNTTNTIQSLSWLIGLILLFSWNLQAESNPPRHSVQFSKSFNGSTSLILTDPNPPISRTATVGQPFRLDLPDLLPNRTSISVTGIPANGLHFETGLPPSIQGVPLAAGVMNLTLVNGSSTGTAWQPIIITVNPDPNSPTTPDPHPPINLTATVGVPFQQTLPYLVLPPDLVSISVTGLPANGLHFEPLSGGPGIQGIPLTAGVMNLTLLVNSSLPTMAWQPVIITVSPDPNPPITPDPHPPINLTATVGVLFQQALPDLLPNRTSISVTGLPANGLQVEPGSGGVSIKGVPLTAGVMNLTLLNGSPTGTAWQPIIITVNPEPGSALTLLAPTYNCATGALHFNTSGGDGSPVTFFAIGITGPTTNPDQFVDTGLRTAADAQPLLIQATQGGVTVTYVWDIRAQCPVGPTPPVGTLTLLAPTYNCTTGAFRFNTSGGDGSAITFSAIGITGPTTNPDQFVDAELRTASDVQPLLLQATQNGVTVTYSWNLKAACGRARVGVAEPERGLRVVVLGNPVVGEMVLIEVSGAEGQPLRVALTNQQGLAVSEKRIEQAAALERLSVKLSRSAGIYLLQVSMPGQTKMMRVLKVD